MLVTKNTRAKKDGSYISCPHCPAVELVHHFAWSELTCTCCEKSVPKLDWQLVSK
jgi:uncharacterized protein (DUF983 family)